MTIDEKITKWLPVLTHEKSSKLPESMYVERAIELEDVEGKGHREHWHRYKAINAVLSVAKRSINDKTTRLLGQGELIYYYVKLSQGSQPLEIVERTVRLDDFDYISHTDTHVTVIEYSKDLSSQEELNVDHITYPRNKRRLIEDELKQLKEQLVSNDKNIEDLNKKIEVLEILLYN